MLPGTDTYVRSLFSIYALQAIFFFGESLQAFLRCSDRSANMYSLICSSRVVLGALCNADVSGAKTPLVGRVVSVYQVPSTFQEIFISSALNRLDAMCFHV